MKKKGTTWYDLQDNLAQSGCPLCRLERQLEDRYLDILFYQNITDPAIRDTLRRQAGFCPEHVRSIHRCCPSVLGIAILYADLTRSYLKEPHQSNTRCPLCAANQEKELMLQAGMIRSWNELKQSWGPRTFLCPRHLYGIEWPDNIRQDLEMLTRKSLSVICEHLDSLIRRFDYQSERGSTTPEESLSWQEALEFFSHSHLRKIR